VLKIIQITDTHLVADGERIFGSDPGARLAAAIDDVNRNHADAALCVLTGDLAHHADPHAYHLLRERLGDLTVPWQILPGNHDDRDLMAEMFPELQRDGDGFLQSTIETPAGTLLFLDSVDPGVHSGRYCERRRRWLNRALASCAGRPAYIFVHHPPFEIALPHIDQYVMAEGDGFGETVARHRHLRHIFFGHVHRPVSGSWRGIPFSALRGTNHQSWLDFTPSRVNITSLEPPGYAVIFLDAERTVVHFHDFLDDSPKFAYDPDAPLERQVVRI